MISQFGGLAACINETQSGVHGSTGRTQQHRRRCVCVYSREHRSVMAAWHHCSTVVRRVGTLIAAMVAQQAPLSWSSSGAAIVNCTLNDTVRGGTIYTGTSPYSIGGWDGKDWQSCASFCQTDPIGGHPCMAWELIPNYKVINTTHPLACLFYATVPDCVKTQASAAVTGCGSKGFAANPGKCCGGGHCAVVGFQCTGAAGLYQCVPATLANGTMFPDRAACLQQCRAPPPPPPGPPPPPPAYSKPYLRFANVVPVSNLVVDCQITQGTTSHKWTRVAFGEFSPWIDVFKAGSATLTISEGGRTLLTKIVPLARGPLVIALRADNVPDGHYWPPTDASIELIAASYTPGPRWNCERPNFQSITQLDEPRKPAGV